MKNVSVTTDAIELAPEGNRDFLAIYNNGTEPIYLCFDGDTTTLTVNNGFPLPPSQALFLNNTNNRNAINKKVSAIASVGPVDVRVQGA